MSKIQPEIEQPEVIEPIKKVPAKEAEVKVKAVKPAKPKADKVEEVKVGPKPTQAGVDAMSLRSADRKRQIVAQGYAKEKKVAVSIPAPYKPYFGSTAMISVNGVSVYIPVDGRSYYVNETHAAEIFETLQNINAGTEQRAALANVQQNKEEAPGSLKF